jgi:hypothetical protein
MAADYGEQERGDDDKKETVQSMFKICHRLPFSELLIAQDTTARAATYKFRQ